MSKKKVAPKTYDIYTVCKMKRNYNKLYKTDYSYGRFLVALNSGRIDDNFIDKYNKKYWQFKNKVL